MYIRVDSRSVWKDLFRLLLKVEYLSYFLLVPYMVDGALLANSEIHITCILKYIGIYVN